MSYTTYFITETDDGEEVFLGDLPDFPPPQVGSNFYFRDYRRPVTGLQGKYKVIMVNASMDRIDSDRPEYRMAGKYEVHLERIHDD